MKSPDTVIKVKTSDRSNKHEGIDQPEAPASRQMVDEDEVVHEETKSVVTSV